MGHYCNTICDRFFKQIEMISYVRREYNNFYNKRVVKSVSVTKGINKKNYLQCSRCIIFLKKALAFKSLVNGSLICPCCGDRLRIRNKGLNSNTRITRRH